jgi:hypothetical protein
VDRITEQVLAFYGVPEEFQTDEYSHRLRLRIDQEPDIEVFDVQGRLVWQSVERKQRSRGNVVQGRGGPTVPHMVHEPIYQ